MKAAVYTATGPARDVLRVVDVPDPEPAAGEVRVRLRFSGVNPTDWRARSGNNQRPMPFPQQTPGQDGAGEIDAVGPGVDPQRVGQRVWAFHAAWQRPGGTAAQLVTVPAERAVPLPESISLEQGAGLGIPFITAHRSLLADGPITGHHVLVAGGAGAVGNAAVQLAKRNGASVAATVSSPEKAEIAERAGADLTVDYTQSGAADTIRRLAPDGIDRVVEVSLGANLTMDLDVLKPGGTIVTYARTTDPTLPTLPLMHKNAHLDFMLVYHTPDDGIRQAVRDITSALEDEELRPLPSIHFPLADIAAAHEALEDGVTGKVLLDIP